MAEILIVTALILSAIMVALGAVVFAVAAAEAVEGERGFAAALYGALGIFGIAAYSEVARTVVGGLVG